MTHQHTVEDAPGEAGSSSNYAHSRKMTQRALIQAHLAHQVSEGPVSTTSTQGVLVGKYVSCKYELVSLNA